MIPLTVLQGHLAELGERAARGELATVAEVASAMNEAHYMASLMHNLAAAAKLEGGEPEVHREPVDLGGIVERAVARHRPIARQREVTLDAAVPEQPLRAAGDLTLLEQAISNVVYNAIRYNRPGGHVAVVLEALPEGRFRLGVIDDGPGIPADELSRLVERGYRGQASRTREPAGQGIGLHIAHRVAALHDLELALGPSPYGGLQVDFTGLAVPAMP
jgi:signal transduction histidine kinase